MRLFGALYWRQLGPVPGAEQAWKPAPPAQGTISARRTRQVLWSIGHYLREVRRLRSPAELVEWIYYKFPCFFPLRGFPSALTLEITNECNFGCPHCHREELNERRALGFMDLGVFEKIVRESAGRVVEVKFIGLGEPALHPQLDVMMRMLRDRGLKTRLYTNGTVFDRYSPGEIMGWGLWGLVVSVDGVDEDTFGRLRPGGDYRSLRKKLAAFRRFRDACGRRSPLIEIRHVMMPNETAAMLRRFQRDWSGGLGDTVKYNLLGPPYSRGRAADPARPPCRDIRRELHIRFDGRVPLCGYIGHREWNGSVASATLQQIWDSVRLNDVRRRHRRRDLSELPFCKTCQHR